MFIHDPDRRARPFHIADETAHHPSYLFALCTAIFDVRPTGVTTVGSVESDDLICGLCLRKRDGLIEVEHVTRHPIAGYRLDPIDLLRAKRRSCERLALRAADNDDGESFDRYVRILADIDDGIAHNAFER